MEDRELLPGTVTMGSVTALHMSQLYSYGISLWVRNQKSVFLPTGQEALALNVKVRLSLLP